MSRARLLALTAGLAGAGALALGGLGSAQDTSNTVSEGSGRSPASTAAPPLQQGGIIQAPPDEAAPPPEPAPMEPAAGEPAANTAADNSEADAEAAPPPAPPKRPRYTTAVLQALDKVTAETLRFEARVNEPVRYKDLVITVRACETNASDEAAAEAATHLDVQYQPDVLPGRAPRVARQVFRGWMFANAPGLNPFQHPIYDVWVIACKTLVPAPAVPSPPPPGANL